MINLDTYTNIKYTVTGITQNSRKTENCFFFFFKKKKKKLLQDEKVNRTLFF